MKKDGKSSALKCQYSTFAVSWWESLCEIVRLKAEAPHWSKFWLYLHVCPCPGAPPWVCRTQGFMSPQQEQGQAQVMRTHLSMFLTERYPNCLPQGQLGWYLITTDNLIHSAKPTVFLILLGNKILVETTYFHLPPKHMPIWWFSH